MWTLARCPAAPAPSGCTCASLHRGLGARPAPPRTRPEARPPGRPLPRSSPARPLPSPLYPLGGAPLRPHAPTLAPLSVSGDSTPEPGRARRLLPEGRRGRGRAEGLGAEQDRIGRQETSERPPLTAQKRARARAFRPSLPPSTLRLSQPCCRAPPASPRLITTAPRVRWPRGQRRRGSARERGAPGLAGVELPAGAGRGWREEAGRRW